MSFHTKNGKEFLGLRSGIKGEKQVVYDAQTGRRVILKITSGFAKDSLITDALREGIDCRNVLGGAIAALKRRRIDVDFAD